MEELKLNLDARNQGAFVVTENGEQLGEMALAISGEELIVYHTEVAPQAEGKGLAKQMLNAMVGYAREHHLKVIPLCPYVRAQFNRHPHDFEDIWKKNEDE